MNEIQLVSKKKSATTGYLFYTDLEKQALGDKFITDFSPTNLQMLVQGSSGTGFGVMDHPTIGRCFQFSGAGFLYALAANMGALSNFSQTPFLLEIGFIKTNRNGEHVFGTGNYADTPSPGIDIMMDQTVNSFQLFLMRSTSSYDRVYIPGQQNLDYNEYSITKTSTTTTVKNVTNGASASAANYLTGSDSYFSIGGSMDAKTSYLFNGYLKYLRVKKQ